MRYCDVLGLHVNYFSAQGKASVLQLMPGILKVLNTAVDVPTIQAWRAARPDGELIFRSVQDDLSTSVQQRVDTLFLELAPIEQYINIIECPWNENYQSAQELPGYASLTNQAIAIIEARNPNIGVGMFSVDNPDPNAFYTNYATKLQPCKCRKYLCVHEYDAPTMQTHGYCGRFTQLTTNVSWPVRVVESGVDGGVLGPSTARKGWRSYFTANQYAMQLQTYAKLLYQNNAKGVVYCCGQFGDWQDFDIAGEPEIISALNEEFPVPIVGPGLQKCEPYIGPFIEDEVYDLPGTASEVSRTATPKGWASWTKATNETVCYVSATGEILADYGNHGDGNLKIIRKSFLA